MFNSPKNRSDIGAKSDAWSPQLVSFIQHKKVEAGGSRPSLSPLVEKLLTVSVPQQVASGLAAAAQSLLPVIKHERNQDVEESAPKGEPESLFTASMTISDGLLRGSLEGGLGSLGPASSSLGGEGTPAYLVESSLSPRGKDTLRGYGSPHYGSVSPAGTLISTLKAKPVTSNRILKAIAAAELAQAEAIALGQGKEDAANLASSILARGEQALIPIDESIPRPTVVMSATVTDLIKLGQLQDAESGAGPNAEAEAGIGNHEDDASGKIKVTPLLQVRHQITSSSPVSVRIATGDGGPERQFDFTHYSSNDPHHNLLIFEHVPGCKVCEELYGHYLLPSGKLAHLCLLDKVVKGHCISMVTPPDCPFVTSEWLDSGLPCCTLLSDPTRHLLSASSDLSMELWCPVPQLPSTSMIQGESSFLEWAAAGEGGKEGGKMLNATTICLNATITKITKIETETTIVAPKLKKKKK